MSFRGHSHTEKNTGRASPWMSPSFTSTTATPTLSVYITCTWLTWYDGESDGVVGVIQIPSFDGYIGIDFVWDWLHPDLLPLCDNKQYKYYSRIAAVDLVIMSLLYETSTVICQAKQYWILTIIKKL